MGGRKQRDLTCINEMWWEPKTWGKHMRWEGEYKSDKEIMNSVSNWNGWIFFTLIRFSLTSPVEQVWSVLDVYSFVLFLRVTWEILCTSLTKSVTHIERTPVFRSAFYLVVFAKPQLTKICCKNVLVMFQLSWENAISEWTFKRFRFFFKSLWKHSIWSFCEHLGNVSFECSLK